MATYKIASIYLWFTMLIATGVTMVTDPCPAPPPCDCDGNNINCDSRNLTEVPKFNQATKRFWWIDLSSNNISRIPSQAFKNITGLFFLKLTDNQINYMADDALVGAENSLNYLFMSNNRMSQLPTSLGKMRNVTSLGIDGNPLEEFQADVLKNVSSTLQYLTFGFPSMALWPESLRYLTSLTSLTVRELNMDYLPISAFNGLENSVGLLEFERCSIKSIPISLSTLNALEILSLDSNPFLPLSGIPGEAFSGMKSISQISIRNQSYDTLPDIFHDALTIRNIVTSGTPITHIDADLIPDNNSFHSVNMDGTLLQEIPLAITKMKTMQTLIITNSSITKVSANDFKGFTKATYIGIMNSPLSEFSDDALRDTQNLQFLFLTNTNLTTIPKAILGLQNLRNVDLEGNRIICNCEGLGWLKQWPSQEYFLPIGECANLGNMSLIEYYRDDVPKCPNSTRIP